MDHPLPSGIFIEMPPLSDEFDGWTIDDLDNEIKRLKKRVKELVKIKKTNKTKTLASIQESDEDDDDIMHDPDIQEMVEMENTPVTCLTHLAKHVKMKMRNTRKTISPSLSFRSS